MSLSSRATNKTIFISTVYLCILNPIAFAYFLAFGIPDIFLLYSSHWFQRASDSIYFNMISYPHEQFWYLYTLAAPLPLMLSASKDKSYGFEGFR